jgi:hypothetical protein
MKMFSLPDLIVNFDIAVSVAKIEPWPKFSIYGIRYYKLNGIDAINKITKLRIIKWKDIIYIPEREITGSG